MGVGRGDSGVGAVLVAPFPRGTAASSPAHPKLPGTCISCLAVTPLPASRPPSLTPRHQGKKKKSSDYPNTVIKGEMCFLGLSE